MGSLLLTSPGPYPPLYPQVLARKQSGLCGFWAWLSVPSRQPGLWPGSAPRGSLSLQPPTSHGKIRAPQLLARGLIWAFTTGNLGLDSGLGCLSFLLPSTTITSTTSVHQQILSSFLQKLSRILTSTTNTVVQVTINSYTSSSCFFPHVFCFHACNLQPILNTVEVLLPHKSHHVTLLKTLYWLSTHSR